MHLHVNARLARPELRLITEVGNTVLAFHRVVGLAAIHPAAIHADAHVAGAKPGSHCGL